MLNYILQQVFAATVVAMFYRLNGLHGTKATESDHLHSCDVTEGVKYGTISEK